MPLFAKTRLIYVCCSSVTISGAFFYSQFDLSSLQNPYLFVIKTAPNDIRTERPGCLLPRCCRLIYPIAVQGKESDLETPLPL